LPLPHCASLLQVLGQLADEPPHTYGAHEGEPTLPAPIGLHVPTFPATSHASQAPVQAELQHTPSTQLPLRHWLLAVHARPLDGFGTHAPVLLQ
jgi:hypothetical protein